MTSDISARSGNKVCVVGGGLMGMALGRRLALDGCEVTILEREKQLGGLATYHDFGGFDWDRFYHVILPSDRHLIGFVRDLGLARELEWNRTRTGFYVDERMHSISSNVEFLFFPLLSFFSKIRLAWTMIYCSRLSDWRRLEKIPVHEWLIKVSGRKTYEKLWKPLLLAKLGKNFERVSAVFIWSYIKRLFSARDKSASAEKLGHVRGGYKMIFEKLQSDIVANGGTIMTDIAVSRIRTDDTNGLAVEIGGDQELMFDKVVCTSPVSVLMNIVDPELLRISEPRGEVEYLGVVCAVIVSNKPIIPFYVVNIADDSIPFTGVIGMSTVVSPKNTDGKYLTYLPKYVLSTDEYLRRGDDVIREEFKGALKRMFPDFDMNAIESVHINRAFKVQPLQVLNYSSLVPQVETEHPGLFILNTSQFVNATLNNNEVIGAVNEFHEKHSAILAN